MDPHDFPQKRIKVEKAEEQETGEKVNNFVNSFLKAIVLFLIEGKQRQLSCRFACLE